MKQATNKQPSNIADKEYPQKYYRYTKNGKTYEKGDRIHWIAQYPFVDDPRQVSAIVDFIDVSYMGRGSDSCVVWLNGKQMGIPLEIITKIEPPMGAQLTLW